MDQQEEFLQLFLRHQADLRAFIGSLVRDRHARDDVFQQTALTLWQELPRYDRARSFGAWARGIAAKKVMQHFDKVRRVPAPFAHEAILAVADAYERTEDAASSWSDALEHCLVVRWDMDALGGYLGPLFTATKDRCNIDNKSRTLVPDPMPLGFSFELDRSDYEAPDHRRPMPFILPHQFRAASHEQYYWKPDKYLDDWKLGRVK